MFDPDIKSCKQCGSPGKSSMQSSEEARDNLNDTTRYKVWCNRCDWADDLVLSDHLSPMEKLRKAIDLWNAPRSNIWLDNDHPNTKSKFSITFEGQVDVSIESLKTITQNLSPNMREEFLSWVEWTYRS